MTRPLTQTGQTGQTGQSAPDPAFLWVLLAAFARFAVLCFHHVV
jgi:hypothetical protein